MMLFYKTWLESRTRFLLSAIALAALAAVFIIFNHDVRTIVTDHDVSYGEYIWRGIFKGHVRDVYVILILMLGLGGLDRERSHGTTTYTLALPVSRWWLVLTRGVTGIVETTVLAFLPAAMVPILSPYIHESYRWSAAMQFAALWTVGGTFIFAMGFISSVLFAGEFSAGIAAIVLLFGYSITVDLPGMERYLIDIQDVMNGSAPHGLTTLSAISFSTAALIFLAGYLTSRKDY
jgi:ABC-2 type transport system permease protein